MMGSRKVYAVGAVAIVVALVVGIVATYRPPSRPPPPAVSDRFEIVQLDVDTGIETIVLANLSAAHVARFMTDGSIIVSGMIGSTRGLWRTGPSGPPVLLWGEIVWPDPSPDGRQLVWFNGDGIVLLDIQNGTTGTIPKEALAPALFALDTNFDQQGRRIAFSWYDLRLEPGPYPSYIATYDLANGNVDVLMETGKQISGLTFLPDGEHIVFAGGDGLYLFDIVLNLTLRLTGPANHAFPRVSDSGDLVVFQSLTRMDELGRPMYRVHLLKLSTGETVDILRQEQYGNPRPDISADGRTIVFIRQPTL